MLKGKNIVLGVTGGIACYKACDLVSRLVKLGANVDVIMTKNSMEFVAPLTFESLSNNPVICDTFKRTTTWDVKHISLAQKADAIVIAPATANIIGKIANGIADDMLSTTVMASRAKVLICPAMNTGMYQNPIYQGNEKKLMTLGYNFLSPSIGRLACGDVGVGKMAEPQQIVDEIVKLFDIKKDLIGKRVMISAGGTSEAIDAVRYITNRSSGKMGIEIAKACLRRGAEVILICGNITVELPNGLTKIIKVKTTQEMYDAVMNEYTTCDYIIKAAAPSDYRPLKVNDEKIKSANLTLELVKNPDIAKELGKIKGDRKLIIFSAETNNLIDYAKGKLISKNADMVVANDVSAAGAGFESDTNIISIIHKSGEIYNYDMMPKSQLGDIIIDNMLK